MLNLRPIQPSCDFSPSELFFVAELEFLLTQKENENESKIHEKEINIASIVLDVC